MPSRLTLTTLAVLGAVALGSTPAQAVTGGDAVGDAPVAIDITAVDVSRVPGGVQLTLSLAQVPGDPTTTFQAGVIQDYDAHGDATPEDVALVWFDSARQPHASMWYVREVGVPHEACDAPTVSVVGAAPVATPAAPPVTTPVPPKHKHTHKKKRHKHSTTTTGTPPSTRTRSTTATEAIVVTRAARSPRAPTPPLSSWSRSRPAACPATTP